jgi:membrane protein
VAHRVQRFAAVALRRLLHAPCRLGHRVRRAVTTRELGRVALALREESRADHLSIVAAGAAFYLFLALLPGITAMVLIYGLVADRADALRHLDLIAPYVPEPVRLALRTVLERAVSGWGAQGFGALGSAVLAVLLATRGARGLIEGINMVQRRTERRGFVALYALSLAFTVSGVLLGALMLIVVIALPSMVDGLPSQLANNLWLTQYLLLPATLLLAIMSLLRFGGSGGRGRWWSYGAFFAMLLWLAASWGLELYVAHLGFSTAFGSVSAIAVFLLWLYACCLAILLGAELNDVLRHRGEPAHPAGS